VVDRFVLGPDGKATSRVSYFDPLPLLRAALARPSGWLQLLRSGAVGALFRRPAGPRPA
jgi:hypothetical protein